MIYEHVPHGRRVVSESVADWVTAVLTENVESGTGTRSQLDSGQVSAGKTGTTQAFHDAWFVGFTPHMSTAVWMGHPDEQVPMGEIQERRATGGWIPARIWSAYMGQALHDAALLDFDPPPPPPRSSQYLFVPGDTCTIAVTVTPSEPPLTFDLPCSMVRPTADNEFEPLPDALCRVAVPAPDGETRFEWIRCTRIATERAARATASPPEGTSSVDETEDNQA